MSMVWVNLIYLKLELSSIIKKQNVVENLSSRSGSTYVSVRIQERESEGRGEVPPQIHQFLPHHPLFPRNLGTGGGKTPRPYQ